MSQIGLQARLARKAAGLTQAEFASKADLGMSALRGVEKGNGRLSSLTRYMAVLDLELRGRMLPSGDIGAGLVAARKRRGVSQRQLAKMLGFSRNTLSALERGVGLMAELERYGAAVDAGLHLASRASPRPFFANAGLSSVHHGWETPSQLAKVLTHAVGRFDLDPCAASSDRRLVRIKARTLWTMEDDGLSRSWFGMVFVNPPYGRSLRRWVEKCASEAAGDTTVIALVPARPDTNWWHQSIAAAADVFMLRGRLKFGDGEKPAPFPSAVVVFNGSDDLIGKFLAALVAWHVPRRRESNQPVNSLASVG